MFEELLVKDCIKLFKFYFSVSRQMQQQRFERRKKDLLRHYKITQVDTLAQKKWDQHSI